MNGKRAYWKSAGTALVLALLLASPGAYSQRGTQVDCREVVRSGQDARSLAELRQHIVDRTGDEVAVRRCGRELDADPQIGPMARAEVQRLVTESRNLIPAKAPDATDPMQLPVNQRVLEAQRLGAVRVQEVKRAYTLQARDASAEEPARTAEPAPAPPPPVITNVVPATLVPGTDIVIEGTDLRAGSSPIVELDLNQGAKGRVVIPYSESTESYIIGRVPDYLTGVLDTNAARVTVRRATGGEAQRFVAFRPIYVTQTVTWTVQRPADTDWWELVGTVHQVTFPGSALVNSWRSKDWRVRHHAGFLPPLSRCDFSQPEAGQTTLATNVWLHWNQANFAPCHIDAVLEGPRGTSTGL